MFWSLVRNCILDFYSEFLAFSSYTLQSFMHLMSQFAGESHKKNKIKPGCTFSHFQGQEDEILSFSSSQEEKKGRAKQAEPDVRSSGAPIDMSSLELIASKYSLHGHSHQILSNQI